MTATVASPRTSSRGDQQSCTCRWCGESVRLVPSRAGVLMPLDPAPHPAGRIVPVPAGDGTRLAQILLPDDLSSHTGPRWRSHYETCSNAVDPAVGAKAGTSLPLSRYRCPECGDPLALVLLILGQASHPSCRDAIADIGAIAGHISGAAAGRPDPEQLHTAPEIREGAST